MKGVSRQIRGLEVFKSHVSTFYTTWGDEKCELNDVYVEQDQLVIIVQFK